MGYGHRGNEEALPVYYTICFSFEPHDIRGLSHWVLTQCVPLTLLAAYTKYILAASSIIAASLHLSPLSSVWESGSLAECVDGCLRLSVCLSVGSGGVWIWNREAQRAFDIDTGQPRAASEGRIAWVDG
jgi:hypothetical protein